MGGKENLGELFLDQRGGINWQTFLINGVGSGKFWGIIFGLKSGGGDRFFSDPEEGGEIFLIPYWLTVNKCYNGGGHENLGELFLDQEEGWFCSDTEGGGGGNFCYASLANIFNKCYKKCYKIFIWVYIKYEFEGQREGFNFFTCSKGDGWDGFFSHMQRVANGCFYRELTFILIN